MNMLYRLNAKEKSENSDVFMEDVFKKMTGSLNFVLRPRQQKGNSGLCS